uniref:E3 ubiquitin-protein ligase RNF182 n=1 Tax=Varanus komodoensis TaxID=61221 RepID=A0A8D2PZH9_VARKO
MARPAPESEAPPGTHETECRICYEHFDGRTRQPKLLSCRHRVCARCLRRMAEEGESPGRLRCPFCRRETVVPEREVARLPEDGRVLALLSCRERARRQGAAGRSPEVLLCPGVLEPFAEGRHGSSDCLVVTLLELPEDVAAPEGAGGPGVLRLSRPPSLASLAKCQPCRPAWPAAPRFLVGVLCLAYLSSLPLGIYLLLVERLRLGLALAGLVPATLLAGACCCLCRCLCPKRLGLPP